MRLGAPLARSIPPFTVCWRVTVGLLRRSGGVRSSRSRCVSARTLSRARFRFVDS